MDRQHPLAWLVLALFASGCGWELCAPGYVPGRYGCIISCRDFPEGGPIRCYTVRDGVAFDTGVDAVMQDEREDLPDVPTDDVDASMDRDDASAVVDGGPVIEPGLAAPRAIAPLSTSTVTSQRPTLRWQNGPSHDGAVVELSRTRDFARIERIERVTGDRVRPSSALSAGVWFWRLRARASARNVEGAMSSPIWWFRVGVRSADGDRDTSWGTELDVNGDGFSDIAVGSPNAEMGRGRVDVFYGGPSGVASTPSVTLRGAAAGDRFGYAIASAGDVNGDGCADLIVGAESADVGGRIDAGSASIYLGTPSGLQTIAHRTIEGANSGDRLGASVSSAGDFNGDGFSDIVVGAYLADPGGRTDAGIAYLYAGGRTGIAAASSRELEGDAPNSWLGWAVSGGGDINGDAKGEVLIGAPVASPAGRSNAGVVVVLFGSTMSGGPLASRILEGPTAHERFGSSLSFAGDVNGDGFVDVLIGAPAASPRASMNAGTTSLFLGNAAGLAMAAHQTLEGERSGDFFGNAISTVADSNGDGFADVAIGAWRADIAGRADTGAVYVYTGQRSGSLRPQRSPLEGTAADEWFGTSVEHAGDVNGDGFQDLVIGSFLASPGGRTNAGSANVYFGAPSGFDSTPSATLEGIAMGDGFGWSAAGKDQAM